MAANTIAMYFKVDPGFLKSADFSKQLEKIGLVCLGKVSGEPVTIDFSNNSEKLVVFQGSDKSHATARVYSDGLITVDIQHFVDDGGKEYTLAYIRALEDKVRGLFGEKCQEANSLYTPIRRGMRVWPYMVTADERLQELDYDKLVCEVDSKWQNIRIYHSIEHGNILYLDGDIMLGESDLIYTQTLCCIGKENYKGKSVLILGGGDGGILHELLKEGPDLVVMAEIDEEVIKACRTYMRGVCGSSMDNYEGPHHQIRIDDCIKVLHEYVSSGKKLDFVINDLTEFPVDKALKGYGYDFETTSLITELSLKALKPDGKLLARGNCLSAAEYRESFEKDIKTVGCEFKRKDVYVPSFHETYCLYEIWHGC